MTEPSKGLEVTLFQSLVNICSNYRVMEGIDHKDLEEIIRNNLDAHYFKIKDKLMETTLVYGDIRIKGGTKHVEGYVKLEIIEILENLFK